MFLATGYPRSGTGYTSALLQSAGVNAGHETVGTDGVVSWLHIGKGVVPWLDEEVMAIKYDKVMHIVRDPLEVIASAQTLSDASFDYMFANLGDHPGGERSLRWYMWSWLKWNDLIEATTNRIFRVEDLRPGTKALGSFLALTGGKEPKEFPPYNVNSRVHKPVTWHDLEQEDYILAGRIKQKAVEYGYQIFRFGAIMMAKNESHNLHRCLKSIRSVVDEIILVDTGSEDDTVEIAKSYGAQVYHHPWADNFSLHRNQSVGYSTCDWMLQIDCDEELMGNAWMLRKFCQDVHFKSKFNAMAVLIKDIHKGKQDMQFNAARIFRRGAVHYEDIVHNRPVFEGEAIMPVGNPVFWFHHYGYDLSPEKKLAKLNRTKTLLELRIKDNPEDWAAYFYMSQIEGELGNDQGVLDNCEHYVKNKDKCERFNRSVYYTHLQAIASVHGHKSEYLEKTLQQYMNEMPDDLDITFFAILHGKETNKKQLIGSAAERFVRIYYAYATDAHKQASRFTYNFKPECLTMALFYVATFSIEHGTQALGQFAGAVNQTEDNFKSKAVADMQFAMKGLGVTWTHNQSAGVANGV